MNSSLKYNTDHGMVVELEWEGEDNLITLCLRCGDDDGLAILLTPKEMGWVAYLMSSFARDVETGQTRG